MYTTCMAMRCNDCIIGMSVDPIRIIVVGAGGMFQQWWERALCHSGDVRIVGMAEPNPEALSHARALTGVPVEACGPSLGHVVQRVRADAVMLISPPKYHAPDAILALSHGLHVLTEKPMADTLANAKAMVAAAEAAGRQLVVAQNRRYEDWAPTLRRMMSDGALGKLGCGHVEHLMDVIGAQGYRATLRHILLEDMAIHHLDLIRAITGRNIIRVSAHLSSPTWWPNEGTCAANLLLTLEGEVPVTYIGNWAARGRCSAWGGDWRLMAEDGAAIVERDQFTIIRGRWGEPEPVPYAPTPNRGQPALLESFVRAVRTGERAWTDGRDNLWSVAAMFAAMRSNEERREVDVRAMLETCLAAPVHARSGTAVG
jgi:predicted dehydrogenase